MKDETKCLHAGYTPKNGEPRVLPIVQSTTYVYESAAEVAGIFDDQQRTLLFPFCQSNSHGSRGENCSPGRWCRCHVYYFRTGSYLAFHLKYLSGW